MRKKLESALSYLEGLKVDYADIRVHDITDEAYSTEDGRVQAMIDHRSRGYGIRVFLGGSMGFAASQDFEKMEQTVRDALAIARASRLAQKRPVKLASRPAAVDSYRTPVEIDPFSVSKRRSWSCSLPPMRKCGRRNRAFLKRRAPSISAARRKFSPIRKDLISPRRSTIRAAVSRPLPPMDGTARYAAIPIASGGILPQRATNLSTI